MFSTEPLKELMLNEGYPYFSTVDEPEIIDDFIYKSPVLAIASKYPIINTTAIQPNTELAEDLGLSSCFSFSRKVIRATIELPYTGACDCYVVHFKSKRSMIDVTDSAKLPAERKIIESLKANIAGSWGSTIQRGSEATLLMTEMLERREKTKYPMILMGDFNNTLTDGVLTHLLTNSLRFESKIDCDKYLAQYCLNDSWDLYLKFLTNNADNNIESIIRPATHYFGASSSVLDYILLSCVFDANHHTSLYQVDNFHTYDEHLTNPIFERDGESTDHAVISVSLSLRL